MPAQKRQPSISAINYDPHKTAMSHIVEATNRASEGRHDEAEYHLESARTWSEIRHEQIKSSGQHDYARHYKEAVNTHIARVRGYKNLKRSEPKCDKDHSKLTKQCDCGYMNKSDSLEKGFLPPTGTPPVGNIMRPRVSSALKVGKSKKDTRYDYKSVTELHPHDQSLAQEKWGKGTGQYEYPVDKQSGRLVHSTRVETSKTPQALGSRKELLQQHRPGQSVRIQGHQTHSGRLGIVRPSHPEFSDKIAVQVGPSDHHKIYVEPHQVKLSKASTQIEKALVTVCNIRKVFMK